MLRAALRNVLAHRARLLMTGLAVMLGVAFVSGTLVFASTISEAYEKGSEKSLDGVTVAIRPGTDTGTAAVRRLDQRLLARTAALPGVESAVGIVSGTVAVADKQGQLIGSGFSTQGGNYAPGADGKDARYPMKEGRPPHTQGEVAVDARTAEGARFTVGDSVRMSVDGPVLNRKVVGIFDTDDGNVAAGGTLVLFDTATAQKLLTAPGRFNEIHLAARPGTPEAALTAEVTKILPTGTEAASGAELAREQARSIRSSMENIRTGLLAFAAISLFVGVFIIANTFTMLVAQRTKEIALLRAVGASSGQVTGMVLAEACAVGAVAAAAGLAAGIGIGALLLPLMRATGALLPDGPLVVSPAVVLVALGIGVGVTMLAAWLPSRRAANVPPVAAMHSVHAPAAPRSMLLRNAVGGILAVLGTALMLFADARKPVPMGLLGLGGLLLLVGVIVLTPALSRPFIRLLGPGLRAFGLPGKIAQRNAVRNPRRTAATASALMIGLTVITSLTVIGTGMQNGLKAMAADGIRADYVVSMVTKKPLAPSVERTLAQLPDVTATSPLRTSPARIEGQRRAIGGVHGRAMDGLTNLEFSTGSFRKLGGDHAVVDKKTAGLFGWKAGDSFSLTYEDGTKGTLKVSGIFTGNNLISGILIDTATLSRHQLHIDDSLLMVKTAPGVSERTKAVLAKALGDNPAVKIRSKQEMTDSISQTATLLLNVLYALLGMAVIVAVLGVINTLALSVFERTQEIGMLGAVGMESRDIRRMVRLESLAISLFGAVLGIVLGVLLSGLGGALIAERMDAYRFSLPWDRIGLFFLLALLVGVVAALWPARSATKINSLVAIKTE
ncbi:ABC transporter [Streptomyces sp. CB02923]|uniref:ABC transporter permease n=1 Tax=Streptomyces sp. CB02923 TaxID=1718985 RepID=UPI000938E4CF|nr:ABC transporter permease [Streptomyces sp. CB02923]OKI09468.1 ABC transporter [Streptomyces sp. CB02923]